MLSTTNANPPASVAIASPPPVPSVSSYLSFAMDQYSHLLAMVQQDVSMVLNTYAQVESQMFASAVQQWDQSHGITPSVPNPAPSNAAPQPVSPLPAGSGSGSGSGSSGATNDPASTQGSTKIHPLISGSGTGSGSGAASASQSSSVTVSGFIWLDNNGDNSFDNYEMGFGGVKVNLINVDTGGVQDTTTVDADDPSTPNYNFTFIPSATYNYQIQVVFPLGGAAVEQGPLSVIDANGYSPVFALAPGGAAVEDGGVKSMNVTTLQDDPVQPIRDNITLRDAMNTGNNGPPKPAVTFIDPNTGNGLDGTIGLQQALPDIQKSYDIDGTGSNALTVRGNGGPGNAYRIFTIDNGVSTNIGGLTISGGYDQSGAGGGGIKNYGSLTLEGATVSGNFSSEDGGGVVNSNGATLNLNGSNVIQNNNAAINGGGIENFGKVNLVRGSNEIVYNEAQGGNGGGIYNLGTVNFDVSNASVTIDQNSALFDGGGAYNGSSGTFNMGSNFSEIANNSAGEYGGGLYNSGNAALDNSLPVSSNKASQTGGGLYLATLSTTALNTITVKGNTAPLANGIYQSTGANLTYTNLTDQDDPGPTHHSPPIFLT